MKKTYFTIQDVLHSSWAGLTAREETKTDRVFRSTRLEDSVYADLRDGDAGMDQLETEAGEKLTTFPALVRDVYQSFYSLNPRRNEDAALSSTARRFNRQILNRMMEGEDYPTIKTVCEGHDLPAYEAAAEFVSQTAGELDDLLSRFGGDTGTLKTLEKLKYSEQQAQKELAALLERLKASGSGNKTLENAVIDAANRAESKSRQVEAVEKLVDASTARNREAVAALVASAGKAAAEKALEVRTLIGAWSDQPGNLGRTEANLALLDHVRKNPALREISRYLGRFREIIAQGKRNGYAYGRGEKYALELGNSLSRSLTSELAMLASPLTTPLFLRKYQRKQIKQYQRREPVCRGMGDIIVCLDESGSTKGDAAAWGKAVALALLDIAAEKGRNFALIHFSGPGSSKTDLFLPGQYTAAQKLAAAETFLDGGTDFATPLREAIALMETGEFEKADIVFLTDGQCELAQEVQNRLSAKRNALGFTVTGILLDSLWPGKASGLEPFCQKLYRTSELLGEEIVRDIVSNRT